MEEGKKRVAIIGSTGSIGTQTLEVIDSHLDKFQVEVLTAQNNADLLISQAKKYKPNAVVIGNDSHYSKVSDALFADEIKVYAGAEALESVVEMDTIDVAACDGDDSQSPPNTEIIGEHHAEGVDHRHYGPGRLIPVRTPAREGLRSPRHHPPCRARRSGAPYVPDPAHRRRPRSTSCVNGKLPQHIQRCAHCRTG